MTDTTPPCGSTFARRPLKNAQAIRIAILRTSCGGIVTGPSSAPSCGKWWSWSTILASLVRSTRLRMSNVGHPHLSTRIATTNFYRRTVRSCAVRASQQGAGKQVIPRLKQRSPALTLPPPKLKPFTPVHSPSPLSQPPASPSDPSQPQVQRNLASGRRGKSTRRMRKGQAARHSCL